MRTYKKGYKNGTATTSILQAAKTGSRENMALALMSGANGNLMDEPSKSNNRGRINRILSGIKLMYDTQNKNFSDVKKRDAAYKRWQENPNTVKIVSNHLRNIEAGNRVKRREIDNMQYGAAAFDQGLIASLPKNESNLTNNIKNLFTNSEENQNVAQGNPDINLQQGPGIARGGANQQLG